MEKEEKKAFQRKWSLGEKEAAFFTAEPAAYECVGQYQDRFGQQKEKHLNLQVEIRELENGYLMFLKGKMRQNEPKFESQADIDPCQGVCARISMSACWPFAVKYIAEIWKVRKKAFWFGCPPTAMD